MILSVEVCTACILHENNWEGSDPLTHIFRDSPTIRNMTSENDKQPNYAKGENRIRDLLVGASSGYLRYLPGRESQVDSCLVPSTTEQGTI